MKLNNNYFYNIIVMEKTINKYNDFIQNEIDTWKSRFTWLGTDGRTPKHTTTIAKFFNETKCIDSISTTNVNDLYQKVSNLADSYVEWVQSKGNNYKKQACDNMKKFFIGALGEFFFVELLNEVRCLYIPDPTSKTFKRYDFHYVSPNLSTDKDFGIDLTGVANDTPVVMQVKFWNPYGKTKLPIEVFQKADSEGTRNGYINMSDDNNIFLCWLGSEESGLYPIKENKVYKNKIVVIGRDSFNFSINNTNKIFWSYIFDKLKKICYI